jgi:sRNA-binding protein
VATLTLSPFATRQARRRLVGDKPPKGPPGLAPNDARRARNRLVNNLRALLALKYPVAFPAIGAPPLAPLAVGIDRALRAQHPDVASRTLRIALRRYTSMPAYLALLTAGATRIDLDGQPADFVTEAQAQHAAEQLQQRLAERVRAADDPVADAYRSRAPALGPGQRDETATKSKKVLS